MELLYLLVQLFHLSKDVFLGCLRYKFLDLANNLYLFFFKTFCCLLRPVLTKRRKAYVTTIGRPAIVLSLTIVRAKKIESSFVSVKTVS